MRRFFEKLLGTAGKDTGSADEVHNSFVAYDLNRLPQDRGIVCHAPFKSIRFEQRGVVRTCCFNRKVVLGRYPEQTLLEIWRSTEAEKLRQQIAAGDFSNGCQQCGLQLASGTIKDTKMSQFDGLPSTVDRYPVMLDFSMHNTCNLECVMCNGEFSSSIRKNREGLPEMPLTYDVEFVRQLADFIPHAKRFVFAGGEPFLIDLYYDIWNAILGHDASANIHIVTNGTILNNRVKELLERGSFHITHSIDSLEQSNFERIRKNADFKRTMDNRSYFMEYCKRKGTVYSMNVCPMQQNWAEIPVLVKQCNEERVILNLLSVFYPPHVSLGYMSVAQLKNVLSLYSEFQMVNDSEVASHNLSQFNDLQARLHSWINDKEQNHGKYENAVDSDMQFGGSIDTFVDHLMARLELYRTENVGFSDESYRMMTAKLEDIRGICSGLIVSEAKMKEAAEIDVEKMVRVLAATSKDGLLHQVSSFLENDPAKLY